MISNDMLSDDRTHLNPNESLTPLTRVTRRDSYPHFTVTKTDLMLKEMTEPSKAKTFCQRIKGAVFPIIVALVISTLVIIIFVYSRYEPEENVVNGTCHETCSMQLVTKNLAAQHLQDLFMNANDEILVYATNPYDEAAVDPIYNRSQDFWRKSNASLTFITSDSPENNKVDDYLRYLGAQVVGNHPKMVGVEGPVMMSAQVTVVDKKHFFITNYLDKSLLRSLELPGILVTDCGCLTHEVLTLFDMCRKKVRLEGLQEPATWIDANISKYNFTEPLLLPAVGNRSAINVSIASSMKWPHDYQSSNELQTILEIIERSDDWIYLSLDSYVAGVNLTHMKRFWTDIDYTLRKKLFETNVTVKVVLHQKTAGHFHQDLITNLSVYHLRSLEACCESFNLKIVTEAAELPMKYLITEKDFYYGSPFWTGDYFLKPHFGVALAGSYGASTSTQPDSIADQIKNNFDMFWSRLE